MGSMRCGAVAGLAVLCSVVFATGEPGRGLPARVTAERSGLELSVGYATEQSLALAVRSARAVVVRRVPALHVAEVRTADPDTLRRSPGIRFVARSVARRSLSEPAVALSAAAAQPLWEWQMHAVRGDAVPDAVLRAASSVAIAVIDTGADLTAPDLAAKAPVAYSTRTGGPDVRDANGHGTFVASLAAGSVTNGDGISGAGGDAQLIVVKAGNADGEFTDLDEAAGIVYAVDHGAKVINLSVGGPTTSLVEQHAIQYATQRGVLLVAAVGNEHAQGNPVEYPAALLQPVGSHGVGGTGLAVTASTANGHHASFANTGSWVSLGAPGENVFGAVSKDAPAATYPRSALPGSQSGAYGYASGTSFAAPQVAGAAALVWAANPSLSATGVAQVLEETASGAGHWTPDLGFGVIDVAAAVARAQARVSGVLLAGDRVKTHVHLNWGGGAALYTLSLSTDAGPAAPVLSDTSQTSTALTVARGHVYAFTVAALDAAGSAVSTSLPLTMSLRGSRG